MGMAYDDQDFSDIEVSGIEAAAKGFAGSGCRLEQICATSKDGRTDLLYSFDTGTGLRNLRMTVPDDMTVPSITGSFWPAFIYENEVHDLFGVTFTDLKLDYKGNFFRTSVPTPWRTSPAGKEAE